MFDSPEIKALEASILDRIGKRVGTPDNEPVGYENLWEPVLASSGAAPTNAPIARDPVPSNETAVEEPVRASSVSRGASPEVVLTPHVVSEPEQEAHAASDVASLRVVSKSPELQSAQAHAPLLPVALVSPTSVSVADEAPAQVMAAVSAQREVKEPSPPSQPALPDTEVKRPSQPAPAKKPEAKTLTVNKSESNTPSPAPVPPQKKPTLVLSDSDESEPESPPGKINHPSLSDKALDQRIHGAM